MREMGQKSLGLTTEQMGAAQWIGLTGMPESDISGDGVTDASDLAILTGNFDPLLCVRLPFVVQPE